MTNRSVREQLLAFHGVEDMSQLSEEKKEEVNQEVKESEIKKDPYGVASRAWKAFKAARKARQMENIIVRASTHA